MGESPTPRIVRQPVEMVVKIASYLSLNDICALRLTCKAMDGLLVDSFVRRFFRAKRFWLHDDSLQALVDMSAHPAISRQLEHVALGTDHISRPLHRSYLGEAENLTSSHLQQLHHCLNSQFHMQWTGADVAMLAKAFANLPNLQTVSIRDVDKSSSAQLRRDAGTLWEDLEYFTSYGTRAVRRATCHDTTTDKAEEEYRGRDANATAKSHITERQFIKALAALAQAGARPAAIEAVIHNQKWCLSDKSVYVDPTLQAGLEPVFSGLTKLHLDLALGKNVPYSAVQWGSGYHAVNFSPCLQKFMSLVPALTWLRLGLAGSVFAATQQLFWWLAGEAGSVYSDSSRFPPPVRFARLEHLEIAKATVSCHIVKKVLARHSDVLRRLNLRCVAFVLTALDDKYEDDVWTHFVRFLADKTDLRSFRVSDAWVETGSHKMPTPVNLTTRNLQNARSRGEMMLFPDGLARLMDTSRNQTMVEDPDDGESFADDYDDDDEVDEENGLEPDYGEDPEESNDDEGEDSGGEQ
ncbi:hypothetical protein NKR19_g3060 [Coniochaeta hoffmannii]|uniref:F-box domain-containing protein n=1 Tax=Coniochaeta hoffmannii TaxID=91930 RepID=A0AA38VYN3_9PEZI|nr:hypothetical protein NKR19_g3060 [Coniochaeta hoffmannii]